MSDQHEHRPVWERATAEMGLEPDEDGILDLSKADLSKMPKGGAVFIEDGLPLNDAVPPPDPTLVLLFIDRDGVLHEWSGREEHDVSALDPISKAALRRLLLNTLGAIENIKDIKITRDVPGGTFPHARGL